MISARKDDPSGAAAHQAAMSAAGKETQENAAIEAVKAGAPIETGNRASKADAIIFKLGRKVAARAGKTGWAAIVDGAAGSRKLGGTQAQKSAAIEAVKAGAPIQKNGGASKKSTIIWSLSGRNQSTPSTWAQRAAAATVASKKGNDKGLPLALKASGLARKTKAFSDPIATYSHECKHPSCRHPAKITS